MRFLELDFIQVLTILVPVIHLLGLISALQAIWNTRTSQGATAWAISLVSFPYVSLPLYWIFGRSHFHGYVSARRSDEVQLRTIAEFLSRQSETFRFVGPDEWSQSFAVIEKLAKMPFTSKNNVTLLVDGIATFEAIFDAIDNAKEYICIEFFIVHDDEIGTRLKEKLLAKAKEGIHVYFLYDEVGSKSTSRKFWNDLRSGGVVVSAFHSTRGGIRNRFQINFRNHRKIVVVDGRKALVGGHNVGDEYLGKYAKFGHWRDTHVAMEGPVVQAVQLAFLEDWYWATGGVVPLHWKMNAALHGNTPALALPSGPADSIETCALMYAHLIHSAKKRIWIASPYFVPDSQILTALELAAMRGVDVRILLPDKADHLLVYLASFSFLARSERIGVRFYRYHGGFLHQKVALVDEGGVCIGTANLDNRSFRLNFEISILTADPQFATEVHQMFMRDFARSRLTTLEELSEKSWLFRLGVKIARLFSPVL